MKDGNYFSERELKIINIIGRKKVTLEEISKELFTNSKDFDASIKVANCVTRIIKKCDHHKLSWSLIKIKKERTRIITIRRVKNED